MLQLVHIKNYILTGQYQMSCMRMAFTQFARFVNFIFSNGDSIAVRRNKLSH